MPQCAKMICIRDPTSSSSAGPNVGAIAGGVIGGVAFVAVVVFLLWRFWIRKKRAQQEAQAEEWEGDDIAQQKALHFQAMNQDADSTRTRGSLANSILSRASNFIQIAYIPGVTTNRNGGSGHNSLGPVPPIPAARRDMPRSPLAGDDGALFFMPGDLRDSTYSATSSVGDRRDTQYTRASITPSLARSSFASGLYRDEAPPPAMPAQQIVRGAPRMVSVKSNSTHSGDSPASTSPKTQSDFTDFATSTPNGKGKNVQVLMPGQGDRSAGGSVKSVGKAHQITLGSKAKSSGRFPVRQPSDSSTLTAGTTKHIPTVSSPLAGLGDDSDADSEDEHARARQSLVRSEPNSALATPDAQPLESPFFDASELPSSSSTSPQRLNPYASMAKSVGTSVDDRPKRGGKGMGGLSDIIEEATRRASRMSGSTESGGAKANDGPFSDKHQVD
ncbi:overproduction-induced pheromone-resistant [Oleoguttula sp. CCFEE 5521]